MTSSKLLTLPVELLLSITQHLAGPALSKLSRTCHFLHYLLASPLDKLFVLNVENMSLWATLSNQADQMRRCLDIALFPNMILNQLALPGYYGTTGVALEDGADDGEGEVVVSTSLLRAVRSGDVQAVRALVEEETDIVRRTFKPVRERAKLIARVRGDKEIEALLLRFCA